MAETITTNYSWTKPDPGASVNTWGATLNGNFDKIDAQVFINNNRGVEIGTIAMFAGVPPPTNWLLCIGQSLSTTGTYAALFAVIRYRLAVAGASFNLPTLVGKFPSGAVTARIQPCLVARRRMFSRLGETPVHGHGVSDSGHTHGVGDPQHTHSTRCRAHSSHRR